MLLICILFAPTHALSDSSIDNANNNPTSDLAHISGKKFLLSVDNRYYDIYYGIILGESSDQDYNGVITGMSIIPEKNSLLINFDNILQTDNAWIRFPNQVLSAEGDKFALFVDGVEKGYEISSHGSKTRLGFIIPPDTHEVEIVGNNVIPEFPTNMLLVFLIIFCMVFC